MPPRRNRNPIQEPPRIATYTPRPLCYHPADLPLEKYENENKIFVPRITYQDLTNQQEDTESAKAGSLGRSNALLREATHCSDQPLLVVHVFSQDNPDHRLIASVEAPHTGGQDEIYMPTYMLEVLGAPEQVRLEFVRDPLPQINKIELRILDNAWALQDPVEALQRYLEDHYVLQENVTLNIQTDMGISVPVFVEKLHPPTATGCGRIQNGDTELEILHVEEPEAIAPVEEPVYVPPIPSAPAVDQGQMCPMIGDYTPPAYMSAPIQERVVPTQDERERIRQARVAKFSNNN
jgi:hypothetical protein